MCNAGFGLRAWHARPAFTHGCFIFKGIREPSVSYAWRGWLPFMRVGKKLSCSIFIV